MINQVGSVVWKSFRSAWSCLRFGKCGLERSFTHKSQPWERPHCYWRADALCALHDCAKTISRKLVHWEHDTCSAAGGFSLRVIEPLRPATCTRRPPMCYAFALADAQAVALAKVSQPTMPCYVCLAGSNLAIPIFFMQSAKRT